MSVVGLDVGNDTLVAAAARQRGIDVLLNAESKRESSTVVAFSHSARLLGAHAAGAASSHAPFSSPKRLLLLASRPAPRDLRASLPIGVVPRHVDHLGRARSPDPHPRHAPRLPPPFRRGRPRRPSSLRDFRAYLPHAAQHTLTDDAAVEAQPLRLMHDLAVTALVYGL
ncbi:hypothetical protein ZWY2020_011902 [Hordeum vulgare]|nr:hypothetical protein ZWY2020_011902 [Hordeum vulgare]